MLKRIFVNLISNAVQAMPEGGALAIRGHRRDSTVLIQAQDTGAGIPEDVKPKLFTPLFTTKSKGKDLVLQWLSA